MKLEELLSEVDRKLEAVAKNDPGASLVLEQSARRLIPELAQRLRLAQRRLSTISTFSCRVCDDGVKCGHECAPNLAVAGLWEIEEGRKYPKPVHITDER